MSNNVNRATGRRLLEGPALWSSATFPAMSASLALLGYPLHASVSEEDIDALQKSAPGSGVWASTGSGNTC